MHAYKDFAPDSSVKSAKDNEADVILSITRDMKRSAQMKDRDFNAFVSAVHTNRRLWTRLASDVANPKNALPNELKANIIYLSEFVQVHSGKVLQKDGDVEALVEINLSVLRGLASMGESA